MQWRGVAKKMKIPLKAVKKMLRDKCTKCSFFCIISNVNPHNF